MTAMTDDEAVEFIQKNEWATGLKLRDAGEKKLFYDTEKAKAIYIGPPESPGRTAYFARVLSLLGADDESMFYGALLWITLHGIGSPQIEKTGLTMLDMMRRGSGEFRPSRSGFRKLVPQWRKCRTCRVSRSMPDLLVGRLANPLPW